MFDGRVRGALVGNLAPSTKASLVLVGLTLEATFLKGESQRPRHSAELRCELGYSLQANCKSFETWRPGAQFEYTNEKMQHHLAACQLVISVGTKKKYLARGFKNANWESATQGKARKVGA